jgi:hypothetical protein
MRDPIGAAVAGSPVSILSGNQFKGWGNPGNQLQIGSSIFWRRSTDLHWTEVPMRFQREIGNNKYYTALIPQTAGGAGDVVQYYLRIAYDDHDTTYLHASGGSSAITGDESLARATPFAYTVESAAVRGQWGEVFDLPNVGIHAHLLPNELVLMWGRRDHPEQSLDEHSCTPFLWDWRTGSVTFTPSPTRLDGITTVNLFCAGHSFLADGRLFVAGGHLADSDGLSQTSAYDATTNTWTPLAPMATAGGQEVRRWYPTCTTLADGRVVVLSGSFLDQSRPPGQRIQVVDLLQAWDGSGWGTLPKADGTPLNYIGLPLYPRLHVADDQHVFMSGTIDRTLLLKTTEPAGWDDVGLRALGNRDYCPAVMYDAGRILYIGGGGGNGGPPTAGAEVIDLDAIPPAWRATTPMQFPRRQHNATVLPDGSVLVTGGTRGVGFNSLEAGQPVHIAERWDPVTETWQELAAEAVDRCYHATALLLPDATVLSAGGGEYRPDDGQPNDPQDSHRNAQIFRPPYLFAGPRPTITSAPITADHGSTFDVVTPDAASIAKVSLVRLPSVTHSFDENQRIVFLSFRAFADRLTVSAPTTPGECPPGHHLLFLVNGAGVPSVAAMVQVVDPARPLPMAGALLAGAFPAPEPVEPIAGEGAFLPLHALEAEVETMSTGTAVTVGITGSCPYGIGACWGGAYEALGRLHGVDVVRPVPDNDDSTAEVFLRGNVLPPLQEWAVEFERILNGTYVLRGVEVTLAGTVEVHDGELLLTASAERPAVRLRPIDPASKLQWDARAHAPRPLEPEEASAYARLAARLVETATAAVVTGPLTEEPNGYELQVRRVDPD